MKIIINADDFGMSSIVNKAIYKASKQGYITSATVLAVAEKVEEAVEMSRELPNISFGIHLVLTDNFKSLTNGKILNTHKWNYNGLNIFKISPIIKEFSLQIEKLQKLGINITHIDTHHHIHRFPLVLISVIIVAKRYKINRIRTQILCHKANIVNKLYRYIHNVTLKLFQFKMINCYTDFSSLENNIEIYDNKFYIEIMCHPGSDYNDELYFNDKFYSKFRQNLINYGDY